MRSGGLMGWIVGGVALALVSAVGWIAWRRPAWLPAAIAQRLPARDAVGQGAQ